MLRNISGARKVRLARKQRVKRSDLSGKEAGIKQKQAEKARESA